MSTVSVRYIVHDVDAAIEFYRQNLGFREVMHPAPTFAILSRGDLRLLLSAPSGRGGGGQAMPDGTRPEPGGWNRISLEVTGLPAIIEELRKSGVHFRNDLVVGVGGDQILLDDPSGNPVELFEPHPQSAVDPLRAGRAARPAGRLRPGRGGAGRPGRPRSAPPLWRSATGAAWP